MTKLKLGAIADERPVRLTIQLPAAAHRDLVSAASVNILRYLAKSTVMRFSEAAGVKVAFFPAL